MRALTGAMELPSPVSSVVIPCVILLAARGSTSTLYSDCPSMSMNPGATTRPAASMRRLAGTPCRFPTAAMRSPTTHTSARDHGAPVPSTTRPPAKSRSQEAGRGDAAAIRAKATIIMGSTLREREIIIPEVSCLRVPMSSPRAASLTRAAEIAAVGVAYFAAARFGLRFAVHAEQVTVVWPPSGIALAALLVLGFRTWPGVWLGALAANALANESLGTALAIATGNTLEAVAAAWLLRRVHFHESLDRVWDVMGLLGLATGLSTTLAATVGATSLCASGLQPWSAFGSLWFVWWLGDAMGILLLAPALLIWGSRPRPVISRGRTAEALALGIGVVAATIASFGGRFAQLTGSHFAYLLFPLLIWA